MHNSMNDPVKKMDYLALRTTLRCAVITDNTEQCCILPVLLCMDKSVNKQQRRIIHVTDTDKDRLNKYKAISQEVPFRKKNVECGFLLGGGLQYLSWWWLQAVFGCPGNTDGG